MKVAALLHYRGEDRPTWTIIEDFTRYMATDVANHDLDSIVWLRSVLRGCGYGDPDTFVVTEPQPLELFLAFV